MGKYDDIIGLPHPASKKHPPVPVGDRAVQFAPFSALTGCGAAVNEAGRLTDERIVPAGRSDLTRFTGSRSETIRPDHRSMTNGTINGMTEAMPFQEHLIQLLVRLL